MAELDGERPRAVNKLGLLTNIVFIKIKNISTRNIVGPRSTVTLGPMIATPLSEYYYDHCGQYIIRHNKYDIDQPSPLAINYYFFNIVPRKSPFKKIQV